MRTLSNILVTGGTGFIGSNFIRFILKRNNVFTGKVVNLDALTYAGNLLNLADIEDNSRYFFEHGNICNFNLVKSILDKYKIDTIVHFAAESHVDRSIFDPECFIKTNIIGTFTLLEAARIIWKDRQDVLFHHVSTDEVYGSLGETGYFTEETAYAPRSPYSASKAGSDHFIKAYNQTYGIPVTLSNCSNNFGPYQFPEKLVPLMILNMIEGKPLPVYGDGRNIRYWLYVEDHTSAIWAIIQNGKSGETYNIGGDNEWENIKLLNVLIKITASKLSKTIAQIQDTINFVKDRPGHDRRYAIDCSKIKKELGWKQLFSFEDRLGQTVDWYLANSQWIESIRSGDYRNWVTKNYENR